MDKKIKKHESEYYHIPKLNTIDILAFLLWILLGVNMIIYVMFDNEDFLLTMLNIMFVFCPLAYILLRPKNKKIKNGIR